MREQRLGLFYFKGFLGVGSKSKVSRGSQVKFFFYSVFGLWGLFVFEQIDFYIFRVVYYFLKEFDLVGGLYESQ